MVIKFIEILSEAEKNLQLQSHRFFAKYHGDLLGRQTTIWKQPHQTCKFDLDVLQNQIWYSITTGLLGK